MMTADPFDNLLWAYRAVFKQTAAGGGNIIINIEANERTVVLYGLIGPNDYAADRSISISCDDGTAGQNMANVMFLTSVDNERLPFPVAMSAGLTNNQGTQFEKQIVLGKGDRLVLTATALVQNEEVTVNVRSLIRAWPPTITTTGSGGTVTTTVTYNKVI